MPSHVEYVGHFGTASGRSGPVQRAANDIEEEPQTNRSAVGEGHVVSGYAQWSTEDRPTLNVVVTYRNDGDDETV